MRIFHTQMTPGLELKGDATSIGRGSNHSLLQTGAIGGKDSTLKQTAKVRPFSSQSKWSIMIKNLSQGLEFMDKQNSNLHEMEQALIQWRDTPACSKSSGGHSCTPETLLYLQVILNLSREKMFNHPLFGSGFEQPIRIHLNLKGERFIQEVPVVPLLSKPGFCALSHSGGGSRRPSDTLFDSCETEFVNSLLEVNQNLEGLKHKLRTIQESYPSSMRTKPLPVSGTEVLTPVSSRVSRFMNWAGRLMKAQRVTPAYSTE